MPLFVQGIKIRADGEVIFGPENASKAPRDFLLSLWHSYCPFPGIIRERHFGVTQEMEHRFGMIPQPGQQIDGIGLFDPPPFVGTFAFAGLSCSPIARSRS
jgi:hypothetical protein